MTFVLDGTDWKVIIERTQKATYAYLVERREIRSDVWLYNHAHAPSVEEWNDKDAVPFANVVGFASEESFAPIRSVSEVVLSWDCSEGDHADVRIEIRGRLHARLSSRVRPGWCRLAIQDGPCAKRLLDE
ncbi:MAG: hypothetical protein U1F29_02760 [Planctomycetota bacterium]